MFYFGGPWFKGRLGPAIMTNTFHEFSLRNAYNMLVKKLKGRDHLKDLDLDGIRVDLREIEWEVWTE
jgi:hypothetical protein